MKKVIANSFVAAMAVVYFLLASQAETVTATLGYICGVLMTIAVIRSAWKDSQNA